MSEKDSNKAQNDGSSKERSNRSSLGQGSNGNTNGFTNYIINPEKFDALILSINNYSAKVDNYAGKIDVAIEQMKKSNENQEKSLALLNQLISKLIPPVPVEKGKKNDSV
jgi:hypothetical protein